MTDDQGARRAAPATPANQRALDHVRELVRGDRRRHLARISRVLAGHGLDADPRSLCGALARAPVTVNFHADRLLPDGRTVAEALTGDGLYRSQFESGISSGALAAHAGGGRDGWEGRLFGGAYQEPAVVPAERPRYGGLNLMNHLDGACARFGWCHLRLRPHLLERCTFSFGDSVLEPEDVGVAGAMEPVLAGLLESTMRTGSALGRAGVDVFRLVGFLLDQRPAGPGRVLDDYIEAQIHAVIRLSADVEAIVLDPSFRDTPTARILSRDAARRGIAVEWHSGSVLALSGIPTEAPAGAGGELALWQAFCGGGRAARLGRVVMERCSVEGVHLDAAAIGRASASAIREPERWREWGSAAELQQLLKYLWLILLAHGGTPGA
jgi:hypothetical protein